jgi:hypothetical protein
MKVISRKSARVDAQLCEQHQLREVKKRCWLTTVERVLGNYGVLKILVMQGLLYVDDPEERR